MGLSLILIKSDEKIDEGRKVYPLVFKYTFKKTEKRFPTHQFIQLRHWKEGIVSPHCPNYSDIMGNLLTQRGKIEKIISEIIQNGGVPTADLVKIYYNRQQKVTVAKQPKLKGFWPCYEEFLKEKYQTHVAFYRVLKTLEFRLKGFQTKTEYQLSFDYVNTDEFELEFKEYCKNAELSVKHREHGAIVGLSNNYVNKLLENLHIFLIWARKKKYITEVRTFSKLKVIDKDNPVKVLVYLNEDEVKKMWNVKKWDYPNTYKDCVVINDYDKKGNIIPRNNKELVKDLMVFLCSVGCRYGDLKSLKVSIFKTEKGFFQWMMEKTKTSVMVPENEISLDICKKYSKGKSLDQNLFPYYSNQKFNEHIKQIGKELGFNRVISRKLLVGNTVRNDTLGDKRVWELLSSHAGRRSFIKNLIDTGKLDTNLIMKLSGHKSIASYYKYVSTNLSDLKKGSVLYSSDGKLDTHKKEELINELKKLSKEEILSLLMMEK